MKKKLSASERVDEKNILSIFHLIENIDKLIALMKLVPLHLYDPKLLKSLKVNLDMVKRPTLGKEDVRAGRRHTEKVA